MEDVISQAWPRPGLEPEEGLQKSGQCRGQPQSTYYTLVQDALGSLAPQPSVAGPLVSPVTLLGSDQHNKLWTALRCGEPPVPLSLLHLCTERACWHRWFLQDACCLVPQHRDYCLAYRGRAVHVCGMNDWRETANQSVVALLLPPTPGPTATSRAGHLCPAGRQPREMAAISLSSSLLLVSFVVTVTLVAAWPLSVLSLKVSPGSGSSHDPC